jgi:hypothetical protein
MARANGLLHSLVNDTKIEDALHDENCVGEGPCTTEDCLAYMVRQHLRAEGIVS